MAEKRNRTKGCDRRTEEADRTKVHRDSREGI